MRSDAAGKEKIDIKGQSKKVSKGQIKMVIGRKANIIEK